MLLTFQYLQSLRKWRKDADLFEQILPISLNGRGYRRQLCVDFSELVISDMARRFKDIEKEIQWETMDVTRMGGIEDTIVGITIDKDTLDAMFHGDPWDPPHDVRQNIGTYMDDVGVI